MIEAKDPENYNYAEDNIANINDYGFVAKSVEYAWFWIANWNDTVVRSLGFVFKIIPYYLFNGGGH